MKTRVQNIITFKISFPGNSCPLRTVKGGHIVLKCVRNQKECIFISNILFFQILLQQGAIIYSFATHSMILHLALKVLNF